MKTAMVQPTSHIEEDLLDQYAMATLPEGLVAEVEEHLLICSFCQKRLVETDEFLTIFREAANQMGARPARQPRRFWPSRAIAWASAAAAVAALLAFLISAERHDAKPPPATLFMQSLRGPGAAAHIVSDRPYRLVFDLPVQATVDYEVDIVDEVGNGILTIRAEVRNGQLLVPLEKLERGSYWVRVFRAQPDKQLVAEYGLRTDSSR
jgi:hypothetical protein